MKNSKIFHLISQADISELIGFLLHANVIKSSQVCKHCLIPMQFNHNPRALDEFEWRCGNYKCKKVLTALSLRTGSWLKNFNTPLRTLLQAICLIAGDLQNVDILQVVEIGRKVLIKLKKVIIYRMKEHFDENPIKLCGPGVIIQVDETKLNFNVKNHRGRSTKPRWCFCMVDTSYSLSRGYTTIVEDRSAKTLIDITVRGDFIHRIFQKGVD